MELTSKNGKTSDFHTMQNESSSLDLFGSQEYKTPPDM